MAELATLARPYAEGVFKLALEKDALAAWSEKLAFLETLATDPQVQSCAADPRVSRQQLEGLILGIAGEKLDGLGRNFAQVLVENGRLALLPQIRVLYEDLRRGHEGVLAAKIISAQPLTDEQLRALVGRLEASYKRKVSPETEVDPTLIGGAKIIVGDKVIDATVRGRLDEMAAALTH